MNVTHDVNSSTSDNTIVASSIGPLHKEQQEEEKAAESPSTDYHHHSVVTPVPLLPNSGNHDKKKNEESIQLKDQCDDDDTIHNGNPVTVTDDYVHNDQSATRTTTFVQRLQSHCKNLSQKMTQCYRNQSCHCPIKKNSHITTTSSSSPTKSTSASSSSVNNCNSNYYHIITYKIKSILQNPILQKLTPILITILFFYILQKFARPNVLHDFFTWMEEHPHQGIAAYTILYPFHMVFFLPGTPLVLGAGFVFKTQYGWLMGVSLCSILTLLGSLVGGLMCFCLGRYGIRETVRRWSRNYPLFDAIDLAVSDNGFKIMCMLYLTPIIPLAPISYMMGTTSMPIKSFAKAKIAALPNTVVHVYVGAATGTLFTHTATTTTTTTTADAGVTTNGDGGGEDLNKNSSNRFEEVSLSPEIMILGILISIMSIGFITIKMKKELQKVLEKQKGEMENDEEKNMKNVPITEKGSSSNTITTTTSTRQRHFAASKVETMGDGKSAFRPFAT